jgi:hypothetical protein
VVLVILVQQVIQELPAVLELLVQQEQMEQEQLRVL